MNEIRTIITNNKHPPIDLLGIQALWAETSGDTEICIAVLDGPVDLTHPCFDGANLTPIETLVPSAPNQGPATVHGTHVASIIFGQPGSPVQGIVPNCRGLILPIFSDGPNGTVVPSSQVDLARAITGAVMHGAHIINISGGELSDSAEAHPLLENAVQHCADSGVLIVSAAGNEGCECLHVPAALSAVLAVGAADAEGKPLPISNWGQPYQTQGILATGENIPGATPGGGTATLTGTSFAAPIVSGVAALMLSRQRQLGQSPAPHAVRDALINSASPCDPQVVAECHRSLVGGLNIDGAAALMLPDADSNQVQAAGVASELMQTQQPLGTHNPNQGDPKRGSVANDQLRSGLPESLNDRLQTEPTTEERNQIMEELNRVENGHADAMPPAIAPTGDASAILNDYGAIDAAPQGVVTATVGQLQPSHADSTVMADNPSTASLLDTPALDELAAASAPVVAPPAPRPMQPSAVQPSAVRPSAVQPSQVGGGGGGSLVYALGGLWFDLGTEARRDSIAQAMGNGANPGDPAQLLAHLENNPWDAQAITWTLTVDAVPVYAIQPAGPFASHIFDLLRKTLNLYLTDGVERVSVPGLLSGQARLSSGQIVPVIIPEPRGIVAWNNDDLIEQIHSVRPSTTRIADEETQRKVNSTLNFLERVYYELRNLGITPQERAINFAATRAYHLESVFEKTSEENLELDRIEVEQSPVCRPESDCWDVKLTFFNPTQRMERAKQVYRFTIDVSDLIPVTIGNLRSWSEYS